MRRLLWFALGAVLGAWAMHKFTRLTRNFTPRGVTARAVGVGERLRAYAADIRADIRAEMTAREAELWSALGADEPPRGPEPPLGWASRARGRHVRTEGRSTGGPPGRPSGRSPGRTPNGRVLDDDKDGH